MGAVPAPWLGPGPGPTATAQQPLQAMQASTTVPQLSYPYPQPYGQPPPYAQPYGQPYPQPYPGLNMGAQPAVYATPQPAQMFTSGVPGAPPTFAIPTDSGTMSQFAAPQGPKPRKAFTLKKGRGEPAYNLASGQETQTGGSMANITVTVTKGQ